MNFENYLIKNGFHQDQTYDRIYYHTTGIKVKFFNHDPNSKLGYSMVAVTDPTEILKKKESLVPVNISDANLLIGPYIAEVKQRTFEVKGEVAYIDYYEDTSGISTLINIKGWRSVLFDFSVDMKPGDMVGIDFSIGINHHLNGIRIERC